MTVFDYIFVSVLALSAAVGMWRGLVSEVISLLAWLVALLAAWHFSAQAAPFFTGLIAEPAWRQVAGFASILVAVLLCAALLRFLLREFLRALGLGAADRLFGAFFGLVRGLLVALVIVLLGGLIGVAREPWWANATFSPPLEMAVTAAKPWLPDAVATRIRF